MLPGVRRIVVWSFRTSKALECWTIVDKEVIYELRIPLLTFSSCIGPVRRNDVALCVLQRQPTLFTISEKKPLVILCILSSSVSSRFWMLLS